MDRKASKTTTPVKAARTAFFLYEKSFCGKWTEVVIYDDRPTEKGPDGMHPTFRLMATLSTDNKKFFADDGTPYFKKLVTEYPCPEMGAA